MVDRPEAGDAQRKPRGRAKPRKHVRRKDMADAQGYLKAEVLGKLKKAPDEEALAAFQELLQRRYK